MCKIGPMLRTTQTTGNVEDQVPEVSAGGGEVGP
jgi:hypothetical protein